MADNNQNTQQQNNDGTQNQKGADPNQNQDPNRQQNNNQPQQGDKGGGKRGDGSIYADLGVDEPGKGGSGSWPDNWRDEMAKAATSDPEQQKSYRKALDRFASPADVAKSNFAAQQRLRSGEYKRAMPADGDEKAMAAWREEQGIPAKSEDYDIIVPGTDMAKLDPETAAGVAAIKGGLHAAGVPQAGAKIIADAFVKIGTEQAEKQAQADAKDKDACDDAMRADWGTEYRGNLTMNIAALEKHLGDDTDAFLTARLPDGRMLASVPAINKMINALARAEGGDIMFDGESAAGKSIEGRIKEIEAVMSTDLRKYTPDMADEYGKLLEKRGPKAA